MMLKRTLMAAVLGSMLAAAAPAVASPSLHRLSFTVRDATVRTASPETYGVNALIRALVYVDGREVVDTVSVSDCATYFRAGGTTVRLSVCGRGPVRVVAANASMREHRVTIRYGRFTDEPKRRGN